MDNKIIVADKEAFLNVLRAMYERGEISLSQYGDSLRRARESKLIGYKEHLCLMLGIRCMERDIDYGTKNHSLS